MVHIKKKKSLKRRKETQDKAHQYIWNDNSALMRDRRKKPFPELDKHSKGPTFITVLFAVSPIHSGVDNPTYFIFGSESYIIKFNCSLNK